MLDLEDKAAANDIVYIAAPAVSARTEGDSVVLTVPLVPRLPASFDPDLTAAPRSVELRVQSWGGCMVRVTAAFPGAENDERDLDASPMIERDPGLVPETLSVSDGPEAGEYTVRNASGTVVFRTIPHREPTHPWSTLQPDSDPVFDAVVYPDGGRTEVPFMAHDTFFNAHRESIGLGCVVRGDRARLTLFSLHARPGERFLGTGERFSRFGLAGTTIVLDNTDALGVSSRRAYKNVPFYVSSEGYGLFIHTSFRTRLSIADISSRAVQAGVESPALDLFFIGGGSVGSILANYRRLTGVPTLPPLWSYGTWMAKMSYFSAEEVRSVANGMREGGFPCDVIHLDTGWFKTDWKCEWEFSTERFPDPERFMRELRDRGFRICLWQLPLVTEGTSLYAEARKKQYIAPGMPPMESKFDDARGCTIDFTNPEAVEWYKGLLRRLLKMGAAAIKTDFGESIDPEARYRGMSAEELHNIYCILYQRAAFEVTREIYPDGIIWARAGWAGSQRYPLHWGGDAAATWDGLAATIRGGLQIGLSGFAFWSHDVPGFHSLPSFMNDRPSDELYVRWTQVGVFTSHLRYHGSSAREPWEYPAVSGIVREWLKLRYALIPYLLREAEDCAANGLPIFRSLVFHHERDPVVWTIEDQFYCGSAFLVAPIMNSSGTRNVYLPEGEWIEFWTGERLSGPRMLTGVSQPLARLPLYVRSGARIPYYPEPAACTDEMELSRSKELVFAESYRGFGSSPLGNFIDL